jgi:hypothetical protein
MKKFTGNAVEVQRKTQEIKEAGETAAAAEGETIQHFKYLACTRLSCMRFLFVQPKRATSAKPRRREKRSTELKSFEIDLAVQQSTTIQHAPHSSTVQHCVIPWGGMADGSHGILYSIAEEAIKKRAH